MKKVNGISINHSAFPSQNTPFDIQISSDFGLQVGQAIQAEWFYRSARTCKFFEQRDEIHKRRMYAMGMQGVGRYKEWFAVNGDMSYLNLNWKIVPVIPKYVDLLANGMAQRDFQIKAVSIDPTSVEEKQNRRKNLETDMLAKDFIGNVKQNLGMDISSVPFDEIPESMEEIDIKMEMEYKPNIEVAAELAIESVLKDNNYDYLVRSRFERDIIETGLGVVKHGYNPSNGIEVSYVDPMNFIYSYTEDPFFQDCFYFGEYKNVNLSEIYRQFPNLSVEERERLENVAATWNNYYEINFSTENNDNMDGKLGVLYFNFKTSREKVWKKKKNTKGGLKVIPKTNDFVYKGTGDTDFEKLTKIEEVWFEGVMILGTNILLDWKVCENMVRSKSNFHKATPNYHCIAPKMYKGIIDSTVNRIIPFADDIQMSWMKLQQIKQRVVPDGQYIDIEGIAGINLGNGQEYGIEDALNMYFQTGSVIGRGTGYGGEFNQSKVPIQEIRHSSGADKINTLWNSIQISLDMISKAVGINDAVDGSNPDKNALVGIQKLAAYSSNVATRHILTSSMFLTSEIAKSISLRVSDVMQYSKTKDDLIRKISASNVTNLEKLKDLYLHDFAIDIELVPDEEERAKLDADLTFEIQAGNLGVEDKFAVNSIKNMKLAYKYLYVIKNKRMKEKQEQEQAKIQAQTQSNIQSTQAASESKAQLLNMEYQGKAGLVEAEKMKEIEILNAEVQAKMMLMEKEFQYNMQLKGVEAEGLRSREAIREDRKDERTKLQATQQSQMIEQRKKDLPAKSFESSGNDVLGGISLGGFTPR